MTLGFTCNQRAVGAVVAVAASLPLLTAYCQLWSGERGVPFEVSLTWAVVTLASWGVFAVALWSARERLAGRIERATIKDLLSAAGLVFGIALAVLLASTVGSKLVFGDELRLTYVGRRVLTLSPILLLVALAVTAGIAAWRWYRGNSDRPAVGGAVTHDWIELPEAPRLRLRSVDVAVIRTARNYCELEAAGRTFLVRVTAKRLEERLAPLGFVRVHRSAIVNLSRVRLVQPGPHGRMRLILDDGRALAVSRAYSKSLPRRIATPHWHEQREAAQQSGPWALRQRGTQSRAQHRGRVAQW